MFRGFCPKWLGYQYGLWLEVRIHKMLENQDWKLKPRYKNKKYKKKKYETQIME
jgi:hypothetical protein